MSEQLLNFRKGAGGLLDAVGRLQQSQSLEICVPWRMGKGKRGGLAVAGQLLPEFPRRAEHQEHVVTLPKAATIALKQG